MNSPEDKTGGSDVELSRQVKEILGSKQREQLNNVRLRLIKILDAIYLFYKFEDLLQDTEEIRTRIDEEVGFLICALEGMWISTLSENEWELVTDIKDRAVYEINKYVGTLVDLFTLLEEKEVQQTSVGMISLDAGMDGIRRLFLARFIASIECLLSGPSIKHLIRTKALVSIYKRLSMTDGVTQDGVIKHCNDFESIYEEAKFHFMGRSSMFQAAEVQQIQHNAESLLMSIKCPDEA